MSTKSDKLIANGGCPVPWTEISTTPTGEWRMCCYANPFRDKTIRTDTPLAVMTSPRMNTIRKAMIEGDVAVYRPWCERCLVLEEQGQTSRRQKRIERMGETARQAINETDDSGNSPHLFFDHFDIKFAGNKCNLRCYMCHPLYSSGVASDWKQQGWWTGPRHINPLDDLTDDEQAFFWEGLDDALPYINVLNFTGGEPLVMDDYWHILTYVMGGGFASQIELHLSTNLTMLEHKGRDFKQYAASFKHVHLQVSIDAYDDHYDYIRYPADFNTVCQNLLRVFEWPNTTVQVSAVVSALSAPSIPDLRRWLESVGIPFRYDNVLTEPKYMRVAELPIIAKDRIRLLWDEAECDMMPLLDMPENPESWKRLTDHLDMIDRAHGTDWRATFPHVGDIL